MPQHPGSRHGSHFKGDVIRANQRTQTALFPHSHNRRFLVPKRFPGPQILVIDFKTVSTVILFDRDISGGDETGWTVTVNGVPEAIISITQPAGDDISVNYALQVAGDDIRVTYDGNGAWAADDLTGKVRPIDQSGVIV